MYWYAGRNWTSCLRCMAAPYLLQHVCTSVCDGKYSRQHYMNEDAQSFLRYMQQQVDTTYVHLDFSVECCSIWSSELNGNLAACN